VILHAFASLLCAAAWSQAGKVAGAVVSSAEWKVTRSPERIEEFIGDVRYKSAADSFSSDWALYKHAEDLWQARGRVRVRRILEQGGAVSAAGERGVWNRKTGAGHLTGKEPVDFSRETEGGPDSGQAGRLEWSGNDRFELLEGLHVWGPRLEAWADKGVYVRSRGRLDLTGGRPVLRKLPGWDGSAVQGALKADQIAAFEKERALSADGKVVGWLELPRDKR
jgi:hypothetical protein